MLQRAVGYSASGGGGAANEGNPRAKDQLIILSYLLDPSILYLRMNKNVGEPS
jgi:hypothetical protein